MDDPEEILKMTLGFFEKNRINATLGVSIMSNIIAVTHKKNGFSHKQYCKNMAEMSKHMAHHWIKKDDN